MIKISSHNERGVSQLLKTWVWWKVVLFVLLLYPVFLLIGVFEIAGSLLVGVSVFVFSVTIYRILEGAGTPQVVLMCLGSISVLAAYFVVFPLIARSDRFKELKDRLF